MPDALNRWVNERAARLATLDPFEDDDSDLEPLLDIVGDARAVALGESMHRVHEFYLLRNRIFGFLVRRGGFTAIALESGFPEARTLDDWIANGGTGLRGRLNQGVTYHFGKCQEMLDLVSWMRERATVTGSPPRLYGMDIPDSAASALPGIQSALDVLDEVDPAFAEHVRATLLPLMDYLPQDRSGLAQAAPAIQSYLALDESRRHALTAGIADLVERMRALRLDYLGATDDPARVEFGIRSAVLARSSDAFLSAMTAGSTRTWAPANIRDAAMADTVEWILEREPRVLIVAANGHIQRCAYSAPPYVTSPMTTMGQHLADRLGDDLVVIGTTYGGGEAWFHRPAPGDAPGHSTPFVEEVDPLAPMSLDARLHETGLGDFFLDLRHAPRDAASALDAAAGTQNGPVVQPSRVRTAFDAVIHIDRVSPWHTWIDERVLTDQPPTAPR
jgi:erythromycin esterase